MPKSEPREKASGPDRPQRALYLYLTVLSGSACWAAMLYFGGKALGTPIATGWLIAMVGVIFFLLLLGLGMAAVASGSAGKDDDGERWLRFDPPARAITVSCPASRETPWTPDNGKNLRSPSEQSERPEVWLEVFCVDQGKRSANGTMV